VAETVTYNEDEPIVPAPKRRARPRKDTSISAASLAASLKPAAPAKILVAERARSATPAPDVPSKRPRIRTVSVGGAPKGGPILPLTRKPRKKANVTLPLTGSYMPIRRGKGKKFQPGTPYGSHNQMLAAEGKQLIDADNEFLNSGVA